jgi:hypothetical protein
MSDDVCGHPTQGGDGPPCQNPPGENGRCHIPSHNDPDAENPQGRDWAIDESDHETILSAAQDGFSKAGCARAAGVGEASLQRYLDAHDDFRSAFMRARHQGERTLVKGPLVDHPDAPNGGPEIDGQHARFLLSTSFDYKKTEKQEVEDVTEGGFGGATELDDETRETIRSALADRYE